MIRKIAFIAFFILSACNFSEEKKSDIQMLSEKIAQNPTDIDM